MTNEEVEKQAATIARRVAIMTTPIERLPAELAEWARALVAQAYEDAERAVFDEHCRCDVTYLSGKEHHADCPVRCVRALKDSLASQPAASAS